MIKPSDFLEIEQQYRERMDYQDINGAWSLIAPWVADCYQIGDAAIVQRILAAFAGVAEEKYGSSLGSSAKEVQKAPTDANLLYRLGYQLQEKNLSSLSSGILRLAHAIAPNDLPILTELVSALERQGGYQEAYTLLEQAPTGTLDSFLPAYLLAFNSVMLGNLARSRDLLPQLLKAEAASEVFMASRIKKMLSRADALEKLPSEVSSPRGNHYIRYGSLLLCTPETCEPVQGHDSYSRMYEVLLRLKFAIDTWKLVPEQILSLPNPASQGIAKAMASLWDIPCKDWFGSQERGLVVAYDLKDTIGELRDLLVNKISGQSLFVYVASALSEQQICPDLLGYRYLEHIPAWQEPRDDSEFSIFDDPEPTAADPEQIKQNILDAESAASQLDDSQLRMMVELMGAIELADAMPLARQASSRREPLWVHPQY
jgi:tetratricopeptide (TPR) repeat protein